jgi:hypothetical protein
VALDTIKRFSFLATGVSDGRGETGGDGYEGFVTQDVDG